MKAADRAKPENPLALWIAQGFGAGRIPVAPGTVGSVIGLGWFALLVSLTPTVAIAAWVASVAISIWSSGHAERMLQQKDPGSVVIDEIVALPLCFASWVIVEATQSHAWTDLNLFFTGAGLLRTGGLFVGFRLFDVWKPWPIRGSQSLPAGWGITVDDLLAAGYVNLCFLGVHWAFRLV